MSVDREDQDDHGEQAGRASLGAFVATALVLTSLGVLFTGFLMFPLAMASDPCLGGQNGPNSALICREDVQELVVYLPWIGLGAALVFGMLGGLVSYRRGRSAFVGIGVGAVCYVIPVVVAWCLAT